MLTKFLSKRLILAIHRDQIETFGGRSGIRDEGLLDSAIEQPRATFGNEFLHRENHDQAAAYLFHLVNNHPFVDGNKRVAFAAADVFLRINGLRLDLSDEAAFDLVVGAASSQLGKDEIAEIFRKNTSPISRAGRDMLDLEGVGWDPDLDALRPEAAD